MISKTITQLRLFFFLLAFSIGLVHVLLLRNFIDCDDICYLDLGDAIFRRDWTAAINGYWSPLYPVVVKLALSLFKPDPYWEMTAAHFVNFFIYLIAFFCFDFFLQQLTCHNRQIKERLTKSNLIDLPEWTLLSLGYILFIWSSTNLVTISSVSPDMCVTAIVYLATGILFKIRLGALSYFIFIFLGVILSLAYLAKALLPMAFIYLFLCIFLIKTLRIAIPGLLIAFLIFSIIVSPHIFVLSKSIGYPTFGESPKLNYMWHTNQNTTECWKPGFPGCGKLTHPVREIFHNPKIYEYSDPLLVTYPPWYDPSYWYHGLKPQFDLKGQIKALLKNTVKYAELFFQMQGGITFSYLILLLVISSKIHFLQGIKKQWILLTPALLAMFIYSFSNVEFRYIAAFVVLFWLGLFSALRFPDSKEIKEVITCVILAATTIMLITSIVSKDILENYTRTELHKVNWQVARALKKVGIQEGDKVAVVGLYDEYHWARMAKVKIIAEVPAEEINNFWLCSDSVKLQIFNVMKQYDVKIIVAGRIPSALKVTKIAWKNINGTPYYFYPL